MNLMPTNLIDGLAAAILLLSFIAVASGRIVPLIRVFALQSVALGLLAAAVAYHTGAAHIYAVAVLTIVLKGWAIPRGLRYVVDRIKVPRGEEPLLSLPASLLACGLLTVVAFYIAQPVIAGPEALATITKNALPIALAVVFIGFFLMISRTKALTQVVGLLVMENGLFLAAYAVAYGMPLIVELGVFFDILVAALIMGVFAFRINRTFDTVDTTILRRLHD